MPNLNKRRTLQISSMGRPPAFSTPPTSSRASDAPRTQPGTPKRSLFLAPFRRRKSCSPAVSSRSDAEENVDEEGYLEDNDSLTCSARSTPARIRKKLRACGGPVPSFAECFAGLHQRNPHAVHLQLPHWSPPSRRRSRLAAVGSSSSFSPVASPPSLRQRVAKLIQRPRARDPAKLAPVLDALRCHSVLPTVESTQFVDAAALDSDGLADSTLKVVRRRPKLRFDHGSSSDSEHSEYTGEDLFIDDDLGFEQPIPNGEVRLMKWRESEPPPDTDDPLFDTFDTTAYNSMGRCVSVPGESAAPPFPEPRSPTLHKARRKPKTVPLAEPPRGPLERRASHDRPHAQHSASHGPSPARSRTTDRPTPVRRVQIAPKPASKPSRKLVIPSIDSKSLRWKRKQRSLKKADSEATETTETEPLENGTFSDPQTPLAPANSAKTRPNFFHNLALQFRCRSRDQLNRIRNRKLFRKSHGDLPNADQNANAEESKFRSLKKVSTSASIRARIAQHVERFGKPTGQELDEESDFVTFRLKVHLREGHGLVIRDASGSSDPYVRVRYQNRNVYKSQTVYKNLNPQWDEEFSFLLDDPTRPVEFEVYDYDRFMSDDFMGVARADISMMRMYSDEQFQLMLECDDSPEDYMGFLVATLNLTPLTAKQVELFTQRAKNGVVVENVKRKDKMASMWLSAVNVILIEAKLQQPLVPKSANSTAQPATSATPAAPTTATKEEKEKPALTTVPATQQGQPFQGTPPELYAKLRLGTEKVKSKTAPRSNNPKWMESFDLHVYDYDKQILELWLKERNATVAKCSIDLQFYPHSQPEERWYDLENGAGQVKLLLTISENTCYQTISLREISDAERNNILQKYSLSNSLRSLDDVGELTVKVYKAEELASADLGGKSDPFCVLELVNARLQTHTEYKTLCPNWQKFFRFPVKDIHEVLEVTVYDEDANNKVEFLGKVAIPLLKVRNCEKRWYCLKDRKLRQPAKGRILLEMDVIWNPVKAAIRTFNPRERRFVQQEPRFKRAELIRQVNRLKEFGRTFLDLHDYAQSCLEWESYPRSLLAMTVFLFFVHFVQLFHLPLLLLLVFVRCHLYREVAERLENRFFRKKSIDSQLAPLPPESDDSDEVLDAQSGSSKQSSKEKDKNTTSERGPTLRGRIAQVTDTLAVVQNSMDFIASLLERVRNTFNFTVPYLSYLAVFVLSFATVLLYFVPLRWIVMVWGVNKFTKKLRKPDYVDNNELLDFLSRVPSDQELRCYRELKGNREEATPQPLITDGPGYNTDLQPVDAKH